MKNMGLAEFKVEDHTEEALKAMAEAIPVILESIGQSLESEAKDELGNSPERIDTGLLRNSITHGLGGGPTAIKSYKGDGKSKYNENAPVPSGSYSGSLPGDDCELYIGTNVDYAPYIHEGTDRLKPNRFLKNAIMNNQDQIEKTFRQGLENA